MTKRKFPYYKGDYVAYEYIRMEGGRVVTAEGEGTIVRNHRGVGSGGGMCYIAPPGKESDKHLRDWHWINYNRMTNLTDCSAKIVEPNEEIYNDLI